MHAAQLERATRDVETTEAVLTTGGEHNQRLRVFGGSDDQSLRFDCYGRVDHEGALADELDGDAVRGRLRERLIERVGMSRRGRAGPHGDGSNTRSAGDGGT